MNSFWCNLVAVLLLCVQTALALAPGRVVCISVRGYGSHGASVSLACSGAVSGATQSCGSASHDDARHASSCTSSIHDHTACECHEHVPVPGSDNTPKQPQVRTDCSDLKLTLTRALELALCTLEPPPPVPALRAAVSSDLSCSAQQRAMKATRLLI